MDATMTMNETVGTIGASTEDLLFFRNQLGNAMVHRMNLGLKPMTAQIQALEYFNRELDRRGVRD